ILRHDPALALPAPGETFPPAPPTARRRQVGGLAAAAVVVIAGVATIVAVAARKSPSAVAPVRGDAVAVVDAVHARLLGSVPVTTPPGAIVHGAGRCGAPCPPRGRGYGSRPSRGRWLRRSRSV